MSKVMIIDDKETFILPLEIGLKKKGIDVISFTNPEEAIEYLKNNTINVLLTDYHMEPAINGDEVIRRVREFNKDIIIYLQTAYSETLPAWEMLEKYDIQGYIDKGEGQEKNIQLIKASLKQSELLEIIKQQQKVLDAQECRNEFLGKFLNRLMGEIGERSMAMGGSIIHLKELENYIPTDSKELYIQSINTISNSSSKLNELIKSLDIGKDMITIGELTKKLNNLFEVTLSIKDIKLEIRSNNDFQILDCNQEILLHILVDIIETLINPEEKNISFECKQENEYTIIELCNLFDDEKVLDKMNKLSNLDNKININLKNKKLYIKI